MQHKIFAYTRVSTDEQAATLDGSLDNQKYRLKVFVDLKNTQERNWGEIVDWYVDDGYSAKDTRRPAYQRMMHDLKRKKCDLILITDLSRLSRNIFDFCNLLNELEKLNIKFLSIKEQFDSTTPSGKMMIYNMINLAQFEREQISERVALGVHSRAMRGLLNGGRPILGFDKDPSRPSSYVVNEKEAANVNRIFRHFLNTGSRAKAIIEIEKDGIKPKLAGKNGKTRFNEKWNVQTLGNILTSAAYIGYHEVNRSNKNLDQSKLKPHQQYKLVKATWPAIISEEDFENTQRLLEQSQKLERARLNDKEDRFYILTGILRCGECGAPLVGQAAHGNTQIKRYYGHTHAQSKNGCTVQRVSSDEIEKAVLDYLWKSISDAGYLNKIEKNIKQANNLKSLNLARDKKNFKDELNSITTKLNNLLLMQQHASSQDGLKMIVSSFESLSVQKKELESKIEKLSDKQGKNDLILDSVGMIGENLQNFERGFKKATKGMKKRLLRSTIKQAVLTPEGLSIFMTLADGMDIPAHQMQLVRFEQNKNEQKTELALARKASAEDSNLLSIGSDIGKIGCGGRI